MRLSKLGREEAAADLLEPGPDEVLGRSVMAKGGRGGGGAVLLLLLVLLVVVVISVLLLVLVVVVMSVLLLAAVVSVFRLDGGTGSGRSRYGFRPPGNVTGGMSAF